MLDIKIALTNLGKYNEGELIYTWLNLPATGNEIDKAFKEISVAEGTQYEEYFISDYETGIPGFKIEEYENLRQLNEQIREFSNLDEWEQEEVSAVMEAGSYDSLTEAIDYQKEGSHIYYSGVTSFEELAQQFVDDGCFGEIPEAIENYIDYEAIGQTLSYDYTHTSNGFIALY